MPFATHRAQLEGGPFQSAPSPFEYPPDLLPQLQDALAQLADIEFLYEARMERLSNWRPGEISRRKCMKLYLDVRRKRERRACERRLSALEQRINSLVAINAKNRDS
jgi:hypothetical protein